MSQLHLLVLSLVFCCLVAVTTSFQMKMNFDINRAASTISRNKILTKTANLGLLTRLEKSGFKLSTAIPLLKKADELDLIGVLEASSDKVLPLVATAIELSPKLLPLADIALKTSSSTLITGAVVSASVAGGLIFVIPDDSITNIALQTVLAVPLGVIVPGALAVGSVILQKLGNK